MSLAPAFRQLQALKPLQFSAAYRSQVFIRPPDKSYIQFFQLRIYLVGFGEHLLEDLED